MCPMPLQPVVGQPAVLELLEGLCSAVAHRDAGQDTRRRAVAGGAGQHRKAPEGTSKQRTKRHTTISVVLGHYTVCSVFSWCH